MIKVLDINLDRKVFEQGSAAEARMIEYGKLFEELHILTLTRSSMGFKDRQIAPNVWAYSTNSSSKLGMVFDAVRMGKRIVFEKKFVRGLSVITAQDPFETGFVGMRIKSKWRIPLHIQLHTDPFSPFFSGFLNSIRKAMARSVLRSANEIRVVSQSLGEEISKRFSLDKSKMTVLPIYTEPSRIENEQVKFDLHARFGWSFILLSVSRLTTEKNIPMMLNVFKKLIAFFPNAGLVVVGDGPEKGKLEAMTKTLGITNNVEFVGWQEDLASYYKTANMFIQTSNFEGYGLSLVEAGLSGLPVVTTAVGLANDLENGKDAYVCPPNDVEYMFKAVYDLVENNSKREELKIRLKHTLESKLLSKEDYMQKYGAMLEKASKIT
jgi:glycosyltransferase involved in cell wall biosynthesis